jgi:hypothetical protein
LHGLDAVAPGWWEKNPDQQKWLQGFLDFHQQHLIEMQNLLANPGPWDTAAGIQFQIQNDIERAAYFAEELRVDTSLPNVNETVAKVVADINAKAEAADAAARQAAGHQQSADVFAQAGLQDAAMAQQAAADAAALEAARQKAAADAATNSAIANITSQTHTNPGLDAAGQQAARARDALVSTINTIGSQANQAMADLANSQKTAINTSTGTVKTADSSSGVTTTASGSTGVITQTNAAGRTVTGTGSLSANGVITTVDQNTGIVTTQNTRTGVVTQTDSTTGKTVTAVQILPDSSGSGTFMIPDTGKTVTTKMPIMGGSDAGKLALVGLLGLLLLRGAVR